MISERWLPHRMQRALLRRSANLPMKLMPIRRSLTVGLCLPLSVAAFSSHLQSLGSLGFSTSTELKMSDKMDQSFPTWRFDTPCTSMEWNSPVNAELSLAEDTGDYSADLVVVGVVAPSKDEDADEDEDAPVVLSGAAEKVDQILGGAVKDLLEENAESFKNGATLGGMSPVLRSLSDGKTTKYVFVGLGCPPKDDDESPHSTAGVSLGKAISKLCNGQKKTASVQIVLPEEMCGADSFAKDFSTAFYQSLYADNRYRTGKKIKKVAEDLKKVCILCEGAVPAGADDSIAQGKQLATGIFLTKDIVNAPHNVLNSLSLADTARRIADDSDGCITCEILDKEACEERSMGAYLGVARGSETPPQFIHLTYNPPSGGIKKKVGVIGKGLLFDTGGYNIKTAMMELMKFDCGGAAAVLGAARAIGALQPEGVEAHFVVAACENMINEKAMVPSDILTASNGKTIEVMNTDAVSDFCKKWIQVQLNKSHIHCRRAV